jgi:hypothetical protein
MTQALYAHMNNKKIKIKKKEMESIAFESGFGHEAYSVQIGH